MALELIFECPRTLNKLRSGPLGKLLDGYCEWLCKCGFSRTTIRQHLAYVSHFNKYLNTRNEPEYRTLSAEDVNRFFKEYPSQARARKSLVNHVRRVRWSINRFVQYLRQLRLFDPLLKSTHYQLVLDAYLDWMRDYQHAAVGTIEIRSHSISQFLEWLGPKASPHELSKLTPETVERFFLLYAQKMGRAARRSMQSALRTFFRFCLYQGYVQRPLDRAVPTLRTYKLTTVPRGLTDEQTQKILLCIDRNNNAGRRDYAICQMLYTYGVRGGQVRALRLEDIDWVKDQILFKASKYGKNSLLPLTAAVGESVLDYLQNARPCCAYPEVFLTTRAPYHPLPCSSTLSSIVARHINTAGIDVHSKGAHAFRHGFATRMLQKGHSLKEVADVLGHRHLGTTFIYTKVDFNALKQVGLTWPQREV
ncbi:MAG: site-specific integrase [Thiomicrorhabdus sp.]|jgi:integrase/recombinase XerD|nr:site-specific integrase [Thiomicrorhabdus sp.]